jgi:hypothetical protein
MSELRRLALQLRVYKRVKAQIPRAQSRLILILEGETDSEILSVS